MPPSRTPGGSSIAVPPVGDAGSMPGIGLLGVFHRKADGAAVTGRGRLAVDRRGDEEQAIIVHVDQAALVVLDGFLAADRWNSGVIECLSIWPGRCCRPCCGCTRASSIFSVANCYVLAAAKRASIEFVSRRHTAKRFCRVRFRTALVCSSHENATRPVRLRPRNSGLGGRQPPRKRWSISTQRCAAQLGSA